MACKELQLYFFNNVFAVYTGQNCLQFQKNAKTITGDQPGGACCNTNFTPRCDIRQERAMQTLTLRLVFTWITLLRSRIGNSVTRSVTQAQLTQKCERHSGMSRAGLRSFSIQKPGLCCRVETTHSWWFSLNSSSSSRKPVLYVYQIPAIISGKPCFKPVFTTFLAIAPFLGPLRDNREFSVDQLYYSTGQDALLLVMGWIPKNVRLWKSFVTSRINEAEIWIRLSYRLPNDFSTPLTSRSFHCPI